MTDDLLAVGDCGDVVASFEFEAWTRLLVQAAADVVLNAAGVQPVDIPWNWSVA